MKILYSFSFLKSERIIFQINKRLERRFKKMEATVIHQRQRVLSQSASLHGDGYHSDCDETQRQFTIRKCKFG